MSYLPEHATAPGRMSLSLRASLAMLLALGFAVVPLLSPSPASAASVTATFNSVTLVANPNAYAITGLPNTIDGGTAGPVFGRIFTNLANATGVVIDYGFSTPKHQVTGLELFNNGGSILNDFDGIGTAQVEVFDSSDNVIFTGPLTAGNGGGVFVTSFPTPLDDVERVRLSNITNLAGHAAPDIIWRELRAVQNVATPSLATEINADGYSDDVTVSGTEGLDGELEWTLYGPVPAGPGDSCAGVDWAGAPVHDSDTVAITGDGLVTTTPSSEPTAAGCYSYADVLSSQYYTADAVSAVGQPSETFFVAAPLVPSISLVKSATPIDEESFDLGQEITYSFVVRNTGETPLTDVTVDETEFTGSGAMSAITCPGGNGSVALAVDESVTCTATYTLTQDDVDAETLENTAVASGTPPNAEPVESDPSSVVLPGIAEPSMTLVKSADTEIGTEVGQVIAYSFLITNTGNVTLTDLSVNEDSFSGSGSLSEPTCPDVSLLPGEDATCTAEYALTQADLDADAPIVNTATAEASPPEGDAVNSEPSSATVDVEAVDDPDEPGPGTDPDEALPDTGSTMSWQFVATALMLIAFGAALVFGRDSLVPAMGQAGMPGRRGLPRHKASK